MESDFATAMQEASNRHPLLMLKWVAVAWINNQVARTLGEIEDQIQSSRPASEVPR